VCCGLDFVKSDLFFGSTRGGYVLDYLSPMRGEKPPSSARAMYQSREREHDVKVKWRYVGAELAGESRGGKGGVKLGFGVNG
jgi:hypothetical protein